MGRRRRSILASLEGGLYTPARLGTERADHFRWALRLAQGQKVILPRSISPRAEVEWARRLELMGFVRVAMGPGSLFQGESAHGTRPSPKALGDTQAELAHLVRDLTTRHEIRVVPAERILRWRQAPYEQDGQRRIRIHCDRLFPMDAWVPLAAGYFSELAEEFASHLRECAASAARSQDPCSRWFLPASRTERFCSETCRARQGKRNVRLRHRVRRAE